MAKKGFITYNSTLGNVGVLDNVKRYIMAVKKRNMTQFFESEDSKNNATAILDLESMDLIVLNVKDILLSDVRDVGVNSNDDHYNQKRS